jgi:hypothetical protein
MAGNEFFCKKFQRNFLQAIKNRRYNMWFEKCCVKKTVLNKQRHLYCICFYIQQVTAR